MNSKPHRFLSVLEHLLKDAEDMMEFEPNILQGDLDRITRSVLSRGVEDVLLVQLPLLCSELERALESGYMEETKGFLRKNGYPNVFLPLYARIFTDRWMLVDEPDPLAIRVLRQILKGFKKFRIDCPEQTIKEKIDEFRAIEDQLPDPVLSWGLCDLDFRGIYPSLSELGDLGFHTKGQLSGQLKAGWGPNGVLRDLVGIQYVADRLSRTFHIHWESFNPKHGPGAVSEPFEHSKFEFPTWPARLDKYFPFYQWGVLNELNVPLDELRPDSPAKLISVPKDYKGPRLIASEPISSQYIQQGIMDSLRRSLRNSVLKHSYNPRSQDPSRDLVLTSSVDRSFSTIDLSSASDRLSCWLVERIFRRNYSLLQAFNAARTPSLVYPDGEIVRLKKFAAQGAAFTFPVQSLVYAIICMGVIYTSNPKMRWNDIARKVRVFGDDIIIPSEYYDRVCNALEACFLKVNRAKSFKHGFFRESCGMDAYKGHDVTPASILNFYHDRRPVDTLSLVETSNNLYLKGFIRTSSALRGMIPRGIRNSIPFVSPGHRDIHFDLSELRTKVQSSGLRGMSLQMVFVGCGKSTLPTRWNSHWQLQETRVGYVEITAIKSKPSGLLSLIQRLQEKPPADSVNWQPGYVKEVKASYRLQWVPSLRLGRRYDVEA